MEPRIQNTALLHCVGTTALVALLLVISPKHGAAYVTEADYSKCQKACEARFRPILPNETNCEKTLKQIRHDLIVVRNYLRTKKICRGRHRKKCQTFKKKAIRSLGILTTVLGNARNCKSMDVTTVSSNVWPLDILHACQGDNDYTDLHDLMAPRVRVLRRITAQGTNYELTRERISRHPEYKPVWPQCKGRLRPARYYIWPLFEFLLALESVGEAQTCLAACRPPTPQERTLEKLPDQVDELSAGVSALARDLNRLTKERSDRLRADFGTVFPCSQLTDMCLEVEAVARELDGLQKEVYGLTKLNPPSQSGVTRAVHRAARFKRRVEGIGLTAMEEACISQEKLARKLVNERRQIQRTVTQKGGISPGGARRFDDLGKAGDDCDWTTECCVPLVCENGHCEGETSLREVLPLLTEVERVAQSAREIVIFTEAGFDRKVEEDLKNLATERRKLLSRLAGFGWTSAVQAWRVSYADHLSQQIEVVKAQAVSVLAEAEADHEAWTVPGSACVDAISALKDITEDMGRVRGRVGDGDPILDPTWVRRQTDDVRALSARIDELKQLITHDCRATSRSRESAHTPVWPVVGLSLLMAVLGLGVWVVLRARRRRTVLNDEEK